MGRKAVFLDRDGVLNKAVTRNGKSYPPSDAASLEIYPEALEAVAALQKAGYLAICVTNQPDVARGTRSMSEVEAMNQKILHALLLDDILTCPHDDKDACSCRKPKPGMLLAAAESWGVDLTASWMVGDRKGDIAAGRAAGCRTVFIDRGYAEGEPEHPADYTCHSIADAAAFILQNNAIRRKFMRPENLKVKIFADGADRAGMLEMYAKPWIRGFTTNPTLMNKAGITDYEAFAREIVKAIPDRPLSFEVFSDDFDEMERQALKIRDWGDNVYVKIPVTDTLGRSSCQLIKRLAAAGVKQNVTALMTLAQVRDVAYALANGPSSYISVFAGRIADTGRDPLPIMAAAVEMMRPYPQLECIWASPRELLNIIHAESVGCHIITVTNDILKKLANLGKDLDEFSLDTVKMFRDDAVKAGFSL